MGKEALGEKATPGSSPREASDKEVLSRFAEVLLHLPGYTRLAWNLLRSGRLSRSQQAVLYAGIGYLALPFDLVPGIIPVAGQMDDLAAILLALRSVVRSLPPMIADQHLAAADVTREQLDADIRALGSTGWWLVRRGAGLAARGVGFAASTLARGAGASWRAVSRRRGGPSRGQRA